MSQDFIESSALGADPTPALRQPASVRPSSRISPEQLAAAERARTYHAGKLQAHVIASARTSSSSNHAH